MKHPTGFHFKWEQKRQDNEELKTSLPPTGHLSATELILESIPTLIRQETSHQHPSGALPSLGDQEPDILPDSHTSLWFSIKSSSTCLATALRQCQTLSQADTRAVTSRTKFWPTSFITGFTTWKSVLGQSENFWSSTLWSS